MSDKELDAYVGRQPKIPSNWRQLGERDLEWCLKGPYHLITFFHPNYIQSLRALPHPPWLLCVQGNLQNLNRGGVTVVGGRNMSLAAANWLETEFPELLQKWKPHVISGGARGVDQKAHLVSARSKIPTWVHLPSGFADIYPENLVGFIDPILEAGGGLITAYGPFTEMEKQNFHERNYNIALHGECTLIVEAKRRSGTMITAKAALDYGRPVGAIPWGPHPISMGNLDLLRDGAELIASSVDLLELYESSQAREGLKSAEFFATE